jgi:hypothetical protein
MTRTTDPDEMDEAQLRKEVKRLRGELQDERSVVSRRRLLRTGGLTVTGIAALLFASDPVAADPQGVYPIESADPFRKIRADRIRYISRTSQPTAPSSGRVLSYVDDGDLP